MSKTTGKFKVGDKVLAGFNTRKSARLHKIFYPDDNLSNSKIIKYVF